MIELKVELKCTNATDDDVEQILDNAQNEYPEWGFEEVEITLEDGELEVLWEGKVEEEDFDEEEFKRLKHHAEGFYGDTGVENVHVEVAIDGDWV